MDETGRENYDILLDYYKNECKDLIFIGEKNLENNNKAKMFLLDVDNDCEINNYKKVFQEYFPFYIKNFDQIRMFKLDIDISLSLLKYGKKTWIEEEFSLQRVQDLGVFGELFNEFYFNIVTDEPIFLSYILKKGFGKGNIKGIDVVASSYSNNQLTLVFSESKFVSTASSATNELIGDIKGKYKEIKKYNGKKEQVFIDGHLNEQYLNRYGNYILNKTTFPKQINLHDEREIEMIINKLNDLCLNEEITFIDAINFLNIKIKFVYFAIFRQINGRDPRCNKENYIKIISEFENNIVKTGIKSYDMEVIFIPIKNKTMTIKRGMSQWS
jgi:hypothetical protein